MIIFRNDGGCIHCGEDIIESDTILRMNKGPAAVQRRKHAHISSLKRLLEMSEHAAKMEKLIPVINKLQVTLDDFQSPLLSSLTRGAMSRFTV